MSLPDLLLQLALSNLSFKCAGGKLVLQGAKSSVTPALAVSLKEYGETLINLTQHANLWSDLVEMMPSQEMVFAIVELFRTCSDWSDEQRAQLARTYQRRLNHLQRGLK